LSFIFLFEKIISIACSVISSIMEDFVIVKKEKVVAEKPMWFHAKKFEDKLTLSLRTKKITFLKGPSGCGKTTIIDKLLINFKSFNITEELLKSKREVEDFFGKNENVFRILCIDDISTDCLGMKTFIEYIQNPGHCTHTLLIGQTETKFLKFFDKPEIVNIIDMPVPPPNKLIKYGKKYIPEQKCMELLKKSNNNVRNFIVSVECFAKFGMTTDRQDDVYSTRTSIVDLMCRGGRGYGRFIGSGIEEHGHMMDVIFTNYNCENIEDCAVLSDSISYAETIDTKIYEGNWDFLPYFTLDSCVIPSKINGNTINQNELKPGSAWTKYYNFCMRRKCADSLKARLPPGVYDVYFMTFMRDMIAAKSHGDAMEFLTKFNIQSRDLDLMNHMVFKSKLKGRHFVTLKKALKDGERRREEAIHGRKVKL